MKTLFTRVLSGFVFAVLMVGGILWNQYSFVVLMSVMLAGALNEYYNITAAKKEKFPLSGGSIANKLPVKWFVIILSLLVYWRSFLLVSPPYTSALNTNNLFIVFLQELVRLRDSNVPMNVIIPVFVFIFFIYELFTKSENPFVNIGWNITAVFWILVPVILTNKMYFERGGNFVMAVFVLIWVYDSAAYLFGSLFGRHPLFKRVSPKKTVEGLIGGLIFTFTFAFFFSKCSWLPVFSHIEWIVLAFVIVIAATFGDLVESLLKRSLGVKDSGSIMPGHGGFLDRFDAYFFAVPFVTAALWIIGQLQNILLVF